MNLPQLAERKECTGCLACVDCCTKTQALVSIVGDDGHLYPVLDKSKCIGCKKCESVCPVVSKLNYQDSENAKFFACWNKDLVVRKNSATAGAFSAIASYVLDNGGIVFGCALDDIAYVHHIWIDSKADLNRLQGSKYTQSDTTGSYKKTLDYLKSGRLVLYSGTGCQVAGLLSFLKNLNYKGVLITVDLICGGVPSKKLIDQFIANEPYSVKKILSFRTKDNGWKPKGFKYNLKTLDDNGQIHDYTGIKNLVTDGFSSELTNRYSCYRCRFAGINRLSDFTIGDLWGATDFKNQHQDGLSLLVAHSSFAVELLEKLHNYLEVYPTDSVKAIKSNYRIKKTNSRQHLQLERVFMGYLFGHCSYNTLKKIYAGEFSVYSPWLFYKIYRWIIGKILR
ncbi:MAG: Coenzyme F420 hydrogenase/dehydrogenase, beta subunit C-terminal domain [Paludibacteraceae bacterium]|nr:Coenzyme F420 hydrogenase/dehydrogenase, beta subunit C-terminal domain [Paludibacteraceae bacterium]